MILRVLASCDCVRALGGFCTGLILIIMFRVQGFFCFRVFGLGLRVYGVWFGI